MEDTPESPLAPSTADITTFPSAVNSPSRQTPTLFKIQTSNTTSRRSSVKTPVSAKLVFPKKLPSIWEHLMNELKSSDFDDSYAIKKERVANFLSVPLQLEKLLSFGYLVCLDSFLYIFTILPIRVLLATFHFARFSFSLGKSRALRPAEKCDLLKAILIVICCWMLLNVDSSQLYHSVRGQSVVKLYVIFNVLEICDKLFSAFGHDILDSLFSKTTVGAALDSDTSHFGKISHFLISAFYVFGHTMILFYMVITLNVSVNSYSNALLTLLLSNQFVEIKGSVFKKFEKENLFQLSCADTVERFQLTVFMTIITLRNYVELTGASSVEAAVAYLYTFSTSLFTPSTILGWFSSINLKLVTGPFMYLFHSVNYKMIETLLTPVAMVIGTEVIVDWTKHAFITKFNQIKPFVYERFYDSLCRDLINETDELVDGSSVVAKRIGFVVIPLACLVIRILFQTFLLVDDVNLALIGDSIVFTVLIWSLGFLMLVLANSSVFACKLWIGRIVLKTALDRSAISLSEKISSDDNLAQRMHQDEKLDQIHRFSLIKRIV